jgi:hypothetical protein
MHEEGEGGGGVGHFGAARRLHNGGKQPQSDADLI